MTESEKAPARRRVLPNDKRRALREEFFARIDRGDISLVDAIKMMRKIAGKTQAEYAKLVGVSPRILIELERGTGNPTLQTLTKIFAPFRLEITVRRR
jgi:DNA-binding XRE family transcriptional regulator